MPLRYGIDCYTELGHGKDWLLSQGLHSSDRSNEIEGREGTGACTGPRRSVSRNGEFNVWRRNAAMCPGSIGILVMD